MTWCDVFEVWKKGGDMAVGFDPGSGPDVTVWTLRCLTCGVVITEGTGTPPSSFNMHGPDLSDPHGQALRRHVQEHEHGAMHQLETSVGRRVTEDDLTRSGRIL